MQLSHPIRFSPNFMSGSLFSADALEIYDGRSGGLGLQISAWPLFEVTLNLIADHRRFFARMSVRLISNANH